MIIKTPTLESPLGQSVLRMSRIPEGQEFVSWLTEARTGVLELLTCAPDETRMRQLQGAAQVLLDLQILLTRTP